MNNVKARRCEGVWSRPKGLWQVKRFVTGERVFGR